MSWLLEDGDNLMIVLILENGGYRFGRSKVYLCDIIMIRGCF